MSQHTMEFDQVLEYIHSHARNTHEQGSMFEEAVLYYLKNAPLYENLFSDVWLWADAPTKDSQDIGIDLVALDAFDNTYWAIQCKCYQEDSTLNYKDLSTFFAKAGSDKRYQHYMIVDTAYSWDKNLKEVAQGYETVRISATDLRESEFDWHTHFSGDDTYKREIYEAREHQQAAIKAALAGFKQHDRGKLIMACGTGKTLTALRLVEEVCPTGVVLFLAPSISLVAQTLRSWAAQSKKPMRPFVVCSDVKASKLDLWETSVADIPYPSTTAPTRLAQRVADCAKTGELTVIFSTYQSIQVVIDAQALGVPSFDLTICDEAHRTTGADSNKEEQSAFTKVHNAGQLQSEKRLYMTATPRVYAGSAKKKAHEDDYTLASMDDESLYGPEFYRLSFGEAVDRDLLTDYRVIVLTVTEEMASAAYQQTMDEIDDFQVPRFAKILGCKKGLQTRGEEADEEGVVITQADAEEASLSPLPMQKAIAFCLTIKESLEFKELFNKVMETIAADEPFRVEVDHVDGKMNSTQRKEKLDWLAKSEDDLDVCRVLSNAKCLSEGIDVPSLDAVMFMAPRKSQVDIIQAVGRVMRKAPNKKYGYIILPIVVPAGMSPEAALDDNETFQVVWQIIQALRSHDERLDSQINGDGIGDRVKGKKVDGESEGASGTSDKTFEKGVQEKLDLDWGTAQWQAAIETKLVKKCGTRVYWEDWAEDVADIAERHINRINGILNASASVSFKFKEFLASLRDSLNPSITERAAVEMLAQHIITLPIFKALFGDANFVSSNPVSKAMEEMIAALNSVGTQGVERSDVHALDSLYESVRRRVKVVKSPAARQKVIKELYEGFFSKAFKSDAEKMGIVYTPNEIVEYILRETDRMLAAEFGKRLGSRDVHILDPFAGTGTFMADLISSDLISDEDLLHKYQHELHSNEMLLLAYYIMVINIETAFHARLGKEEYVPFKGAVLCDTFQMSEGEDTLDIEAFIDNSERVLAQNEKDIRVIVGNPPYSAGQKSANDNNANERYETLDGRIADTYAAETNATFINALYDSYIRAIRWAADRIGDAGVVCFVSNAGWVDSQAMDGMRICLAEEFSSIYVYHLRGNQRTQGEESRREGGKVFGSGSRAPIAITLLVKNPHAGHPCEIRYKDIGDYLSREEKLRLVHQAAQYGIHDWEPITPDAHGDWLNQRDDSWYEFAPLGLKKQSSPLNGIFSRYSLGVATNRDPWVYSYSLDANFKNVELLLETYNSERLRFHENGSIGDAKDFVSLDPRNCKWTRSLFKLCEKNRIIEHSPSSHVVAMYRPFCKQWVYFEPALIETTYQQPKLFPPGEGQFENLVIALTGGRSFSAMMTDCLPDLHFIGDSQCFPLYWYEKVEDAPAQGSLFDEPVLAAHNGYIRHCAITDEALSVFQEAYPQAFSLRKAKDGGPHITKEDIFYYVYGLLHSPEYRERFVFNLQKELPRIPLAKDFEVFARAGRELAHWHLNYETIEPYPLKEVGCSENPGRTKKITFGKAPKTVDNPKAEDKTVLRVAENLELHDVPLGAYDYVVNGKSAIGWLMDRYQVKCDKASGITNDPNDYSSDPRYIVDLVKRVVRVSMETNEIVGNLPALNELPQPANWPLAWKQTNS